MESYRWAKTSNDYGSWYQAPDTSSKHTSTDAFPAQSEDPLLSTNSSVKSAGKPNATKEAEPAATGTGRAVNNGQHKKKHVTYQEPFSSVYGAAHEGLDTASNIEQVKAGLTANAEGSAKGMAFDDVYGDQFNGKDTESGLQFAGGTLAPEHDRAARENFSAAYGDEFNGRDTESGLQFAGGTLAPEHGRAAREDFSAAYGDEHAGKDTAGNLSSGMVPVTANPGQPYDNVYGMQHANKDTESSLAFTLGGVAPEAGKGMREGFAAAYGDEHVGKDTQSGIEFGNQGVTTSADRAAPEAFDACYGDEHIGMDTHAPHFTRA